MLQARPTPGKPPDSRFYVWVDGFYMTKEQVRLFQINTLQVEPLDVLQRWER